MNNRQVRNDRRRRWARRGGGYAQIDQLMPLPAEDWTFSVKQQITSPYDDCGSTLRPGQLINQPNPDLAQKAMAGGRRTRRHRGGGCGCMRGGAVNGFSVNVGSSVGGTGPNAAPVYTGIPCESRFGLMRGGGESSCSRAPGSELPVYNVESAGFRFEPSTSSGAALPDGVTAYNEVVPYAARLGGGRRSRRRQHRSQRHKKSRRTRK